MKFQIMHWDWNDNQYKIKYQKAKQCQNILNSFVLEFIIFYKGWNYGIFVLSNENLM